MNFQEIIQAIEAVVKLIEALKGIGVDVSGVKLATSQPVDLLALFTKKG